MNENMERWEIEEKIRALELLNQDECERPSTIENRKVHIEFLRKLLNNKPKERYNNEIRIR
jgi:hypothetical protein